MTEEREELGCNLPPFWGIHLIRKKRLRIGGKPSRLITQSVPKTLTNKEKKENKDRLIQILMASLVVCARLNALTVRDRDFLQSPQTRFRQFQLLSVTNSVVYRFKERNTAHRQTLGDSQSICPCHAGTLIPGDMTARKTGPKIQP